MYSSSYLSTKMNNIKKKISKLRNLNILVNGYCSIQAFSCLSNSHQDSSFQSYDVSVMMHHFEIEIITCRDNSSLNILYLLRSNYPLKIDMYFRYSFSQKNIFFIFHF